MSVPRGRTEMLKRPMAAAVALILATFALAGSASAGLLAPGASTAPDTFLPPSGTIVADTGVLAWSSATMSGTFQEYVVRETGTPLNLPCGGSSGCLDFIIQVTMASTSPDSATRITSGSYAGFLVDAGYQVPTTNRIPLTADRSLNGNVVGFNFLPAVAPGTSTAILEIQTNATSF